MILNKGRLETLFKVQQHLLTYFTIQGSSLDLEATLILQSDSGETKSLGPVKFVCLVLLLQ